MRDNSKQSILYLILVIRDCKISLQIANAAIYETWTDV